MRFLALLAAGAVVAAVAAIDPCKRQPFRGRCPSKDGEVQKRSQFVLRYYMRNGECVSYPYGHCASDESEPQLYRYKEECEDACINPPPGNLGSPKDELSQTYSTVGTNLSEALTEAVTQKVEISSGSDSPQAESNSRAGQQPTTTAAPKTECERRRAAASASSIRGGFVPACTAQGAFEKVQCEPDGRQCFCVDARGIEVANSRTRNGQKPDCEGIQSSIVPKTKECVGAAARGPCTAALNRWYYDEQEAKCKRFTFSGCGGNGNNYETEEACVQRCTPMGLPKCERGEPLKTKFGVKVNCAKSDCPAGYKCSIVQQSSVCCPENNKINDMQTADSADLCSLPKERGPCDKYELRFYYNADLKECKYFFWGGCEGNGNNFEKVEDCESTCGIAKGKDSLPTTIRPTTTNNRQPVFRTTQGIRITPGNLAKNEETMTSESSTFTFAQSTSPPSATVPRRIPVSEVHHSQEFSTTMENSRTSSHSTAAPATLHVEPARAAPVPQMTLLEVNRCLHPRDPGDCRGQFIRWYWDNEKKVCDVFTYTGCQGNGNNYASREECLAICHKEATPVVVNDLSNVCKHDVEAGECNGVFQRFAFDSEAGECRPFTYGGCGGNGNNFATLAECRIKCQKVALSPGNLCEHDIEVGECSGVFVRFGYDKATNDCRQFTYGGCGGNGNNFATMQECRNVCVKKVCNPNPMCDLTRCQIVNDRNGCPFCSCPPLNQPSPPGSTTAQCPEVDTVNCREPCMLIINRKGCKDCVCPSLTNAGSNQPPASGLNPTPQSQSTSRPTSPTPMRPVQGSARPPASPSNVGPPSRSAATSGAPPGFTDRRGSARQESVATAQSSQTKQIEIGVKQLLPPPLSAQLQEKCMQPVEPGPCKHFVDRWFFNSEDGICHPFKYGGCAGNRNHFFSQNECEIHCARFLRIVSDDDNEDEDADDADDVPRRAAGVTQAHPREPIGFEHYLASNPQFKGNSHPSAAHEDMAGYSVGREPVPLSPTGIGRNMERLDIEGLEEPTTVVPLIPSSAQSSAANIATPLATLPPSVIVRDSAVFGATPGSQTLSTKTPSTVQQTPQTATQQTRTTQQATSSQQTTTSPQTTTASTTTTRTQTSVVTQNTQPTKPAVETPRTSPPPPITTQAHVTQATRTQPSTASATPRAVPVTAIPAVERRFDASIVCVLPPDAGSCFDYVPRWFFNAQTSQCEQFSYGSCGGNENNFLDRTECEVKCLPAQTAVLSHVPERCTYERDGGYGKGYNVKWYFNMKNLRCEQFVYEGSGGNSNQFDTLSDCERTCSPQPGTFSHITQPASTSVSPAAAPASHDSQQALRPLTEVELFSANKQTIQDISDYDEGLSETGRTDDSSSTVSANQPIGNSIESRLPVVTVRPPLPSGSEASQSPGNQPRTPTAQAAKTIQQKERAPEAPIPSTGPEKARQGSNPTGQTATSEVQKTIYKAQPLPERPPPTGNEGLPIVGASPPMSVNYQTGEVKNRASGIRTFQESSLKAVVDDSDLTETGDQRRDALSCPNGLQEIRYADGRPVMCLPGKNQCPEKSVCFFNGMDFFCCPDVEDPYDKHIFGGYDGEETKHGYKVFGPLNIRRLMDDVPLRARRDTHSSHRSRRQATHIFSTGPVSFSLDSITAPLRFDDDKPQPQMSRALRMRPKPSPPQHGNPICIEPLAPGDCGAAHLRFFYDRNTDKCRLFYYTGCKGNNNNFGSLVDCQRLCVLSGQRPKPQSQTTVTTIAPILRGQCPGGKAPLGGSAPVLCGNTTDSIGCPVGFYCLRGPPDVCCPHNVDEGKKSDKSNVRYAPELPGVPRAHSNRPLLSTPKFICPDASDPLMESDGEPRMCGAGFDGMKMCPKGFYCAIDVEKQTRMCCSLYGASERIPTEQVIAPYLGRRPSNPGEVLERGSLPFDQIEFASRGAGEATFENTVERRGNQNSMRKVIEATTSMFEEASEELEGDTDDQEEDEDEEGLAHLMLKAADSPSKNAHTLSSTVAPESADEHSIDLKTEPPVVEETKATKTTDDKSVCQIKPSEGRVCREDEKPPRTNLHYFYSPKDRRCKLYFYRGCGGNANRFEKKADCERLCLV